MGYDPSDIAVLQARRRGGSVLTQGPSTPVTEGWRDGALTVFVAGKPRHFKGSLGKGKAGHTKRWRERTADVLLRHAPLAPGLMRVRARSLPRPSWAWSDTAPKRIAFTIYSRNPFDDDNQELVASPCRDGLKDALVIDDDKKSSGHAFTYAQVVSRQAGAVHGIAIRIELASSETDSGASRGEA